LIYGLEISPNKKFLLAFTKEGPLDGTPMIYIWELSTLKKRAQISINQQTLQSVHFSLNSNLLLVLSTDMSEPPSSVIGVWDFLESHAECLCRSQMPILIEEAKWNLELTNLEFISRSRHGYVFWKIDNLELKY